uniref:CCHC-type domain-containing protein n=1 Tax=Haemonchus contortus TaxID=6289 RepID=A0A7I5EDQ5_HAECO
MTNNYKGELEKLSKLHEAIPSEVTPELRKAVGNIQRYIKVAYAVSNNWTHHLLQHACSESGAGEQILLLGRLLRSASCAKAELLDASKQLALLYSITILVQEKQSKSETPELKNENVQNKVEKTLKMLDSNIEEIELEMTRVEKILNEEKACSAEIKKMLKCMEKKVTEIAPQGRYSDTAYEIEPAEMSLDIPGNTEEEEDSKRTEPQSDDENLAWLIEESGEGDEHTIEQNLLSIDDETETKEREMANNEVGGCGQEPMEDESLPTPNEPIQKRTEQEEDRWKMEDELEKLEHSFNYLPKRKIQEFTKNAAFSRCSFCGQQGKHFSDSCPRITRGFDRWDFIEDNGLCRHCLEDCSQKGCSNRSDSCWYCEVILKKAPILRSLVPQKYHHRALCPIPDSKPEIAARIKKMKKKLFPSRPY